MTLMDALPPHVLVLSPPQGVSQVLPVVVKEVGKVLVQVQVVPCTL